MNCILNNLVTILNKEVRHQQVLQIGIDHLHLKIQYILEEQQLVDNIVCKLAHTGKVPRCQSEEKYARLHGLHHLVHSHSKRDDVVGKLLEVFQ